MSIGNQVEWVLHCMAVIARVPEGKYIPTKVLAEFHGIPKEYLSKGLQQLAKRQLIEGTLGPKGGYRLLKKPEDITFLDIVQAIENDSHRFVCKNIRLNNPCLKKTEKKATDICTIARIMNDADEVWRQALKKVTLADLEKQLEIDVAGDILSRSENWFAERF